DLSRARFACDLDRLGADDPILPAEFDCRIRNLSRLPEAARIQTGHDHRWRDLRPSDPDRIGNVVFRRIYPPVTFMWRGTAGVWCRRSMMKSCPLGLRLIASAMDSSRRASSAL